MKATGEVMAIDRTFEAAIQKAVRSLEFGKKSLLWEDRKWFGGDIASYPLEPNDLRLWALMAAIRRGIAPQQIFEITKIDLWFLDKLKNIVNMEERLLAEPLTPDFLWQAKQLGFSDEQISTLADRLPEQVRQLRHDWNIRPVYKMVDTCAAEFDAVTPYFYSTYEQENEAIPYQGNKAVVIGSGPIRIGQGIEFDYCSVHSARALQASGYQSIMVNSNPETVSTDFDTSDRLYFEALDSESLCNILENETCDNNSSPPSIVQFGGQTAINLAEPLFRANMPLLGSSSDTIDLAEDRKRFENFLNQLGIPQAPGAAVNTVDEALRIAQYIGYPVLVRPSYVLGGRAMEIVHNDSELILYAKAAAALDTGHPVLIDKYLEGKEVEIDAVGDGETVFIPGIMEHIERAGVHSGDSMAVYPGVNLTEMEVDTIVDYSVRIGLALNIRGLMNIQFVIVPDDTSGNSKIYILEVNPRASRTIPFISKVTGISMIDIATRAMLNTSLKEQGYISGLFPPRKLIAIKAPVFSMSKLLGVDTHVGPEMKSTGEVMGIDFTFEIALTKALLAAGLMLPEKGAILFSIADRDKVEALPVIKKFFDTGFRLYATEGTSVFLQTAGLPVKMIGKKLGEGHPNVVDVIKDGVVDGVINTITGGRVPLRDGFYIRRAAAEKRIPCFTSLDTARAAAEVMFDNRKEFNVKPLPEYRLGKSK
jgi:carbamoyl-phosphate synthase large subunit